VHFLADPNLIGSSPLALARGAELARVAWSQLIIQINDPPDAEA
jgi:hypothetical protein